MTVDDLGTEWVKCAFCSTANRLSNQFCSNCGAILDIETRITLDDDEWQYEEQEPYEEKLLGLRHTLEKLPNVDISAQSAGIELIKDIAMPTTNTVQNAVFGIISTVIFVMIGIGLGPTFIESGNMLGLGEFFGAYYYLGISLGAISIMMYCITRMG